MKKGLCLASLAALLLLLALTVGLSHAQGPGPQETTRTQASLGGGFTYQGRLTDSDGSPVDDICAFDFTLWDAESGGALVGHQLVTGVEVDDGYLTVLLNSGDEFGVDAFEGQERWLKIAVKCSSDGDWSILSRRQRLGAAPYALSLRPGAVISGTVEGESALTVVNGGNGAGGSFTSEAGRGVFVDSPGSDGLYVHGAGGDGVYVLSPGQDGVGVNYAGRDGISVYSPGRYGVYVYEPSERGVRIDSAETDGVYVFSPGQDGVYVDSAGYDGVYVESAARDGMHINSADRYGVWAHAVETSYGFYTPDSVYVGGKIDLVGAVDPVIGERFEVDPRGKYEVGDLLVIDPDSPYLVLSSQPNDTRVVGVVGPGVDYQDGELMVIVFGWHGADPASDDYENVRTVARIKADASYGTIRRGDLLTTSPTPGHAMKARPVDVGDVEIHRPGTIIGKALESLDSGQGVIEIFVALQ